MITYLYYVYVYIYICIRSHYSMGIILGDDPTTTPSPFCWSQGFSRRTFWVLSICLNWSSASAKPSWRCSMVQFWWWLGPEKRSHGCWLYGYLYTCIDILTFVVLQQLIPPRSKCSVHAAVGEACKTCLVGYTEHWFEYFRSTGLIINLNVSKCNVLYVAHVWCNYWQLWSSSDFSMRLDTPVVFQNDPIFWDSAGQLTGACWFPLFRNEAGSHEGMNYEGNIRKP